MATMEVVNIGTLPNDGEGDPLRVAFSKINNNFANLFATATATTLAYTIGLTPDQVIWQIPKTEFTHGTLQVRSGDPGTPDSQDITITAQLTNNLDGVKWTGFASTFNGNSVATYDMDVLGGNVRLLATPFANVVLQHFISSTVSYTDTSNEVLALGLDGFSAGYIMSTENDVVITTE